MAVQVSYPGVYIDEFAPGAPIEGVGTSTAAFVGPCWKGNLNEAVKITSFDQFKLSFGEQPIPGFFLWYAVRGFFQNGGKNCYIVRASNGKSAADTLNNAKGHPVIQVRAQQLGDPTPQIQVAASASNLLTGAKLFRPTATAAGPIAGGREITLQPGEGANFRPADWVSLGPPDDRVQIVRVTGDTLRFDSNLGAHTGTVHVRLADTVVGTRTLRIETANPLAPLPPGVLVAGTMLTLNQGGTKESQIVESVQAEVLPTTPNPTRTYRTTLRRGLDKTFTLDPTQAATAVQSEEFDLKVSQGLSSTLYPSLSLESAHPGYFARKVNDPDGLVNLSLAEPQPADPMPDNLPQGTVSLGGGLGGGAVEDLTTLGDADLIAGLNALQPVDDVNLVAIPDATTIVPPNGTPDAVQQAMISHCEQLGDRFAVLDALPKRPLFGSKSIEEQRAGLDSTRGYAALYYPWLRVSPAVVGDPFPVPPSGHVCGIMADTDSKRGVHKAPANQIVNDALGVQQSMSDEEHGLLNLGGINVIRILHQGARPTLYGARTTATDKNWQYVNIRRLFLFLEESIQEGIRWAVFEPNNTGLWQKLRRSITDFLTRVWRDGGLFGETTGEAFYVRIDDALNPVAEQALGRLHIEIGVRPSYPAEFIIVRIGIWYGGSQVSEQ